MISEISYTDNEEIDVNPDDVSVRIALLIICVCIGQILYTNRNNLDVFRDSNTWGFLALVWCFIMTSGQVWNYINQPPFVYTKNNGENVYVSSSLKNQLVAESYLIMIYYAAVTFGVILLTEAAGSRRDSKDKQMMAVAGLCITGFFFSMILSIYREKIPYYPL